MTRNGKATRTKAVAVVPEQSDDVTPDKKALFLSYLATKLTVTAACASTHISRETAYRWRRADASFKAEWDASIKEAIVVLEDSMYERALKTDTTAAIFMLKASDPKYRERVQIDSPDLMEALPILKQLTEALKAHNIKPSDIYQAMLNKLANEAANVAPK